MPRGYVGTKHLIDEIAVLRAVQGDRPSGRLTRAERVEITRILARRGATAGEIARVAGCCTRTVTRYRKELAA